MGAVESDNITISTFDDSQEEIYHMISHDAFSRYKKSPLWPKLLKDVGCYNIADHSILDQQYRDKALSISDAESHDINVIKEGTTEGGE